jgi:hypothetical protein
MSENVPAPTVKDRLTAVVQNPAVRKTFVAFVMAVLAALGVIASQGCSASTPAVAVPAPVACAVNVLVPVVGEAVAAQILTEAAQGSTETAERVLGELPLAEGLRVARELRACAADSPDAG